MELTQDQKEAYDAIQSKQIVFVSGPAGTGKSFLIHYIQEQSRQKEIPYITLSSTGISAHHIEGMTVHGFLCRLKLKLIEIQPNTIFIVDEISMLGKKIMDAFECQLRKHFCTDMYFDPSDFSNPFGGQKIVFFGDFAQLPPIDDAYCFDSDAWSFINAHHELTTIKRQNDASFKTFLSHVRLGKLTRDDKLTIESMTRRKAQTTTQLFLSNKEAEEFNIMNFDKMIASGSEPIKLDSKIEAELFTSEEQDQFFKDRHQCYKTLHICIGATCMLTANLDVQNGWCNGTLGKIKAFTNDEIIMENTKGHTMSIPRKMYYRFKKRVECDVLVMGEKKKKRLCGKMECEHTPMYAYIDNDFDTKEMKRSVAQMVVHQFPILLAWGITIHKSQGMTLDSCTITLPFIYSPSLIYVALSRCKNLESIVLKTNGPIRYEQICPSSEVMKHIFNWESKVCKICNETYLGPYASFCQDCCAAPGKYSFYRFIDFIPAADPTPDMVQYLNYAIHHPEQSKTVRWKKFITFAKSPMCQVAE
jgi:ATP-dependent DNA helicase PIF1